MAFGWSLVRVIFYSQKAKHPSLIFLFFKWPWPRFYQWPIRNKNDELTSMTICIPFCYIVQGDGGTDPIVKMTEVASLTPKGHLRSASQTHGAMILHQPVNLSSLPMGLESTWLLCQVFKNYIYVKKILINSNPIDRHCVVYSKMTAT